MKLALFLLALCTSLASARIGETPAECAARYGKEIKPGTYVKGGITIDAWFHEGRCVAIRYSLEFPDMVLPISEGHQEEFPRAVSGRILEANEGESFWTFPQEVKYLGTMVTKDGTRRASLGPKSITIQLVSDIERRQSLVTPAALDEATKGF